MSAPLSEQKLAEIRAREDAAFPGPWRVVRTRDEDDCGDTIVGIEGPDVDLFVVTDSELADDDAAFIAHAREDVPALLAEVDRLRAERDQFADRVDTLTSVAQGNKRHVQLLTAELAAAQAQPLGETERTMLAFALDLAGDVIASRGDEFSDDDRAALESLRGRATKGGAS